MGLAEGAWRLAGYLRAAQRILMFTGAGISTSSGIPDFRGPQGIWTKRKPVYYQEFMSSEAARIEYWDFKLEGAEVFGQARPNAVHTAIRKLEDAGKLSMVLTQNVDGLHYMAGSKNILELHGNILNVRCSECGAFAETWGDDLEYVPRCEKCNGLLRPDVVWFEESLPREQLEAAVDATHNCQVFFSIGTSGVVHPAAALAHAARSEGSIVVEINAEPTPLTSKVDFAFHGKSGEILPELVKAVWGI